MRNQTSRLVRQRMQNYVKLAPIELCSSWEIKRRKQFVIRGFQLTEDLPSDENQLFSEQGPPSGSLIPRSLSTIEMCLAVLFADDPVPVSSSDCSLFSGSLRREIVNVIGSSADPDRGLFDGTWASRTFATLAPDETTLLSSPSHVLSPTVPATSQKRYVTFQLCRETYF